MADNDHPKSSFQSQSDRFIPPWLKTALWAIWGGLTALIIIGMMFFVLLWALRGCNGSDFTASSIASNQPQATEPVNSATATARAVATTAFETMATAQTAATATTEAAVKATRTVEYAATISAQAAATDTANKLATAMMETKATADFAASATAQAGETATAIALSTTIAQLNAVATSQPTAAATPPVATDTATVIPPTLEPELPTATTILLPPSPTGTPSPEPPTATATRRPPTPTATTTAVAIAIYPPGYIPLTPDAPSTLTVIYVRPSAGIVTPVPTATRTPTTTPTSTPLPPIVTNINPPSDSLGLPRGTLTLHHPLSLDVPTHGLTIFEWEWVGSPLSPRFGFEVSVWLSSEYRAGVHDAVKDNAPGGEIVQIGPNRYQLRVTNIRFAQGVQGRTNNYLWTVGIVQVNPNYVDYKLQADPAQLRYEAIETAQ